MVLINHFYNKQFLFKFLSVNKFCHIHFANKKFLFGHICNRCFTLSVSAKNDKGMQKLPKQPDPIFEKFEKILNDLSVKQGNDFEFPTNFGSVRFDSDLNFTLLDKLSDGSKNTESNFENTENFIENTFFDNSVLHNSNEIDEDKLNFVHQELKDQDLNYIDDQYIKVGFVSETNTSNKYNSKMKPDSSSLNFIDSQITGLSNQTVRETESDAGDNQTITETKLDADENVEHSKEKLSHYFNFKDSVNETIEENFVIKVINHDSNDAGDNQTITETKLDADDNQTITETKLDADDNVEYAKEKLSSYYNFEDSINETVEENFVKKVINHDSNVDDEKWRKSIETRLLNLAEEGSNYFKDLNQSQDLYQRHKLETKDKIIKQKNIDLDSDEQEMKCESESEEQQSNVKSAYSFVMEKRREERISTMKGVKGEILDGERFKKILLEVPSFSLHSSYDLAKVLRANILFQNDDFLAISKPYGIPIHGGGSKANDRLNIINTLPILAELIKVKELKAVHRLDKNVTGVLLLAKTDQMAEDLKKMFKQHKIKKTYCAIVKGVPEHVNGVIDIPIGEGRVENKERMVLRPNVSGFHGKPSKHKKAITRYKVISTVPGASLLEINPITGIKHQIRVHLGFGLDCPVIGDHKYSYLAKIVPQRLPFAILGKLGIKQSKVRNLPLLLHSLAVTLPIIGPKGTEIVIGAVPPKFFRTTLKALNLSSMRSRLTNEYSDLIFENNNKDFKGGK